MANESMKEISVLELADRLEYLISRMHVLSSPSAWEWGVTETQSDEAHVTDFGTTLRKTREHFKLQGDTAIHGVFVEGTDLKLAVTGNSPSAEHRAEYLCTVSPKNITALIAYIREKEGQ